MEDLGAAVPRLPAQDAVGHEQEIALVQAADPVPEVAPHQDTGRLQPVDRLCPAVVEVAGLVAADRAGEKRQPAERGAAGQLRHRSEEHTSELPSLMRTSYAVFCLKKKNN